MRTKTSTGTALAIISTVLLLACILFGSCATSRNTERAAVKDTVWSLKVIEKGKADSVVYREKVVIEPHIIKTGDTTIIRMDTTVVRLTERNLYTTNYLYRDTGAIHHDSVVVKKVVEKVGMSQRQRAVCVIGVLLLAVIAIASVLYKK